jgi:hypothetical protein
MSERVKYVEVQDTGIAVIEAGHTNYLVAGSAFPAIPSNDSDTAIVRSAVEDAEFENYDPDSGDPIFASTNTLSVWHPCSSAVPSRLTECEAGNGNMIYALTDPMNDDEVRYVGMTTKGMSRPKQHFHEKKRSADLHKDRWISKLKRNGLKYGIVILEEVDSKDGLPDAERKWISYFRSVGARLTNATEGGEGLFHPSDEVRERMSQSTTVRLKEMWKDPLYREKISDGLKKSWENDEIRQKRIFGIMESNTPERLARQSASMNKRWGDSEYQKKVSDGLARSWNDEKIREKRIAGIKNSRTPKSRAQQGVAMKKRLSEDQELRKKISDGLRAAWKRRKERAAAALEASASKERSREVAIRDVFRRCFETGRLVA